MLTKLKFLLLTSALLLSATSHAERVVGNCKNLYSQKQYQPAFATCQVAARQSATDAQRRLDLIDGSGKDAAQDDKQAFYWHQKAGG